MGTPVMNRPLCPCPASASSVLPWVLVCQRPSPALTIRLPWLRSWTSSWPTRCASSSTRCCHCPKQPRPTRVCQTVEPWGRSSWCPKLDHTTWAHSHQAQGCKIPLFPPFAKGGEGGFPCVYLCLVSPPEEWWRSRVAHCRPHGWCALCP